MADVGAAGVGVAGLDVNVAGLLLNFERKRFRCVDVDGVDVARHFFLRLLFLRIRLDLLSLQFCNSSPLSAPQLPQATEMAKVALVTIMAPFWLVLSVHPCTWLTFIRMSYRSQ